MEEQADEQKGKFDNEVNDYLFNRSKSAKHEMEHTEPK